MAMLHIVPTAPADAWGPLPPHACPRSRRQSRSPLRWLERLLLTLGVVLLGYYGYAQLETYLYQQYEDQQLEQILRSRPAEIAPAPTAAVPATAAPMRPRPAPGAAIGRIEIPRLGVSVVVRSGSDARTLRLAVGHIPGTALPGEAGNVGLAGHRDTFFRRLRNIRLDDEIRVTTTDGTFSYRVARTDVVNPKDVWVLNPTEQPSLTLVTCYPFSYVGSAPQRFIVRAALTR